MFRYVFSFSSELHLIMFSILLCILFPFIISFISLFFFILLFFLIFNKGGSVSVNYYQVFLFNFHRIYQYFFIFYLVYYLQLVFYQDQLDFIFFSVFFLIYAFLVCFYWNYALLKSQGFKIIIKNLFYEDIFLIG